MIQRAKKHLPLSNSSQNLSLKVSTQPSPRGCSLAPITLVKSPLIQRQARLILANFIEAGRAPHEPTEPRLPIVVDLDRVGIGIAHKKNPSVAMPRMVPFGFV